jgi:hypothetical protein
VPNETVKNPTPGILNQEHMGSRNMGSGLEFIQHLWSPSDMVRSIRIEFAGALYHVTSRGDRREPIHEDDADRECFLKVPGQVAKNFNRGPVDATSFYGRNEFDGLVRRDNARPANQMATPNSAPTPAVKAIARAPQKVTREAATRTGAPPVFAANEPSNARNKRELPGTVHISEEAGNNRTTSRGRLAPTENVPAEANAA